MRSARLASLLCLLLAVGCTQSSQPDGGDGGDDGGEDAGDGGVDSGPPPPNTCLTVTSITPNFGPAGTSYTLYGTCFQPGAAVFFDIVQDYTAAVDDENTIEGTVPLNTESETTVPVSVTNIDGQNVTLQMAFTYGASTVTWCRMVAPTTVNVVAGANSTLLSVEMQPEPSSVAGAGPAAEVGFGTGDPTANPQSWTWNTAGLVLDAGVTVNLAPAGGPYGLYEGFVTPTTPGEYTFAFRFQFTSASGPTSYYCDTENTTFDGGGSLYYDVDAGGLLIVESPDGGTVDAGPDAGPLDAGLGAPILVYSSGNSQTAVTGSSPTYPFLVQVTDTSGVGLSGVRVNWAAATGGGSISPATEMTDIGGFASATATLGTTDGRETFTATSAGLNGSPVIFAATAATPVPPSLSVFPAALFSDGITSASIVATVKDANGKVITGIPVVLSATGPASVLDPLFQLTDAAGQVAASLTSTQNGQVTVTATVGAVDASQTLAFSNPSCTLSGFANAVGTPDAFGSPVAVGSAPQSVAEADFNGDGNLDLAVANSGDNTVTVLLGNGSGLFTDATTMPLSVGKGPSSVATSDFNGDGIPNLAVANSTDGTVSVLLGSGTGTFTNATGSPIGIGSASAPAFVATGDVNADGWLDLVVANSGADTVSVLLGNGSGGFTGASGSPINVGKTPIAVTMGDFTGSGSLDLAIANEGDDTVSILLGIGGGAFASAEKSPITVGTQPASVTTGDFNQDGVLDLAVANSWSGTVSVLAGEGTGIFKGVSGSPFTAASAPSSLAAGDLNGDGWLDLAVANAESGNVSLLMGNSTGFVSEPPVTVGATPQAVIMGGFTGNGELDLVTANNGSDNVSVMLNQCM